MPPPAPPRVQNWHQIPLQLGILGPGEHLPGDPQELLPLRVPQGSRQQRPQLVLATLQTQQPAAARPPSASASKSSSPSATRTSSYRDSSTSYPPVTQASARSTQASARSTQASARSIDLPSSRCSTSCRAIAGTARPGGWRSTPRMPLSNISSSTLSARSWLTGPGHANPTAHRQS